MLSRFVYPLGGLLFGCALVAALELALRVSGVAERPPRRDPFSGFSSAVPVFERGQRDDGTAVYKMAEWRFAADRMYRAEPQHDFLADPPADNFRVFVIGGSSAAGFPYSTEQAFSSWLEQRLRHALPDQPVEVVNAALVSYGSRRLLPMVHAIAEYAPDLLVVYMGHNEAAEASYHRSILEFDPRLFRMLEFVYRTRIYRLAARMLPETSAPRELPDEEGQEWRREMFGVMRARGKGRGYADEREVALRDLLYERNLREMADTMKSVGARVALLTLSQNFSDWAPAASRYRTDLSVVDRRKWEKLVSEGARWEKEDDAKALDAYTRALEIDGGYAELHFHVAGCHRRLGALELARQHYLLASDLDEVPHGAPTHFNDIVRRVAEETDSLFVDVYAAFGEESGADLVGNDLFTDFAHPNLRAHQRIGELIADALQQAGVPQPGDRWLEADSAIPATGQIYAERPELRTKELQSRVICCLINMRDACRAEADRLIELAPDDKFAHAVLRWKPRGRR